MADYQKDSLEARKKVLEMVHKAGTSHIGSNFSIIDIATVLYDKVDLKKDRVLWSKGWAAATAYYFLAQKGVIPKEDLDTFCQEGSKYIGLVEPDVKGIDFAGGSMGFGLPAGVGFALSKKLKGEEGTVYVIMGDGEQAIGTTWEAAAIAAHHELDNLRVIVDCNGFQAMGKPEEVLNMEPLKNKWGAFRWDVCELDGHNHEMVSAFVDMRLTPDYEKKNRPLVAIAKTVKGKGVSFMENLLDWHYKNVDATDYERALKELV